MQAQLMLTMLLRKRVQALVTQLGDFAGVDSGSLPALRSHLWLAGADTERTAQSLRCAAALSVPCLHAKLPCSPQPLAGADAQEPLRSAA